MSSRSSLSLDDIINRCIEIGLNHINPKTKKPYTKQVLIKKLKEKEQEEIKRKWRWFKKLPPEQRAMMREKWQSMSIEERRTLREQLRQASPEQRRELRRELLRQR